MKFYCVDIWLLPHHCRSNSEHSQFSDWRLGAWSGASGTGVLGESVHTQQLHWSGGLHPSHGPLSPTILHWAVFLPGRILNSFSIPKVRWLGQITSFPGKRLIFFVLEAEVTLLLAVEVDAVLAEEGAAYTCCFGAVPANHLCCFGTYAGRSMGRAVVSTKYWETVSCSQLPIRTGKTGLLPPHVFPGCPRRPAFGFSIWFSDLTPPLWLPLCLDPHSLAIRRLLKQCACMWGTILSALRNPHQAFGRCINSCLMMHLPSR